MKTCETCKKEKPIKEFKDARYEYKDCNECYDKEVIEATMEQAKK